MFLFRNFNDRSDEINQNILIYKNSNLNSNNLIWKKKYHWNECYLMNDFVIDCFNIYINKRKFVIFLFTPLFLIFSALYPLFIFIYLSGIFYSLIDFVFIFFKKREKKIYRMKLIEKKSYFTLFFKYGNCSAFNYIYNYINLKLKLNKKNDIIQ